MLGWLGLCCGDCPVHDRILSSIPGLCPSGASDNSPLAPFKLWQSEMSADIEKYSWGWEGVFKITLC